MTLNASCTLGKRRNSTSHLFMSARSDAGRETKLLDLMSKEPEELMHTIQKHREKGREHRQTVKVASSRVQPRFRIPAQTIAVEPHAIVGCRAAGKRLICGSSHSSLVSLNVEFIQVNAYSRPMLSKEQPLRSTFLDPETNNFPRSRMQSELLRKVAKVLVACSAIGCFTRRGMHGVKDAAIS